MIVIGLIDWCGGYGMQTPHPPHVRRATRWRGDPPPDPEFANLWCTGVWDQERQNRRVVVRVSVRPDLDLAAVLVGEGLTVVGSVHRPVRETRSEADDGCGECRHPEDFAWDPVRWEGGAPVITCHAHGNLAPGWAYGSDIEIGLEAWRNPQ